MKYLSCLYNKDMKKLLLFLFAPLMYEKMLEIINRFIIQAGVSSTVNNLIKCNKGDVLFIKGSV